MDPGRQSLIRRRRRAIDCANNSKYLIHWLIGLPHRLPAKALPIATDKTLSGSRQDQMLGFHPKVSSRSTDRDSNGGLQASLNIKGEPKLMS
ncbi:MAG: hypothetical protein Q8L44_06475 [Sulfuritalea sp.]|nr:hypothetical protein [Sulfuritalea sp.]